MARRRHRFQIDGIDVDQYLQRGKRVAGALLGAAGAGAASAYRRYYARAEPEEKKEMPRARPRRVGFKRKLFNPYKRRSASKFKRKRSFKSVNRFKRKRRVVFKKRSRKKKMGVRTPGYATKKNIQTDATLAKVHLDQVFNMSNLVDNAQGTAQWYQIVPVTADTCGTLLKTAYNHVAETDLKLEDEIFLRSGYAEVIIRNNSSHPCNVELYRLSLRRDTDVTLTVISGSNPGCVVSSIQRPDEPDAFGLFGNSTLSQARWLTPFDAPQCTALYKIKKIKTRKCLRPGEEVRQLIRYYGDIISKNRFGVPANNNIIQRGTAYMRHGSHLLIKASGCLVHYEPGAEADPSINKNLYVNTGLFNLDCMWSTDYVVVKPNNVDTPRRHGALVQYGYQYAVGTTAAFGIAAPEVMATA